MVVMDLNPVSFGVIRFLSGMSQSDLSRVSGTSQSYISGIESGDKRPSPKKLRELTDAMGVPLAAVLRDPTPEQIAEARQYAARPVIDVAS